MRKSEHCKPSGNAFLKKKGWAILKSAAGYAFTMTTGSGVRLKVNLSFTQTKMPPKRRTISSLVSSCTNTLSSLLKKGKYGNSTARECQ